MARSTSVHPGSNCSDPGVNDDDGEAEIDVEWSSAAAPSAAIEMVSCADTETTFGGFFGLANILNGSGTLPSVVSISYGESEAENGATQNAYINSLYQQAAGEGVSVFVAAGDEGAASSDADLTDRDPRHRSQRIRLDAVQRGGGRHGFRRYLRGR